MSWNKVGLGRGFSNVEKSVSGTEVLLAYPCQPPFAPRVNLHVHQGSRPHRTAQKDTERSNEPRTCSATNGGGGFQQTFKGVQTTASKLRTRSTTTIDRNLQFRGIFSTGFSEFSPVDFFPFSSGTLCKEVTPKIWRKLPEKNA